MISQPNIDAISSGTVAEEYDIKNRARLQFTLTFLKRKGIGKFAKTHWDQLSQSRIDESALNICMNQRVYDNCKGKYILPTNTIIWDINDVEETEILPTNDKELEAYYNKIYEQLKTQINNLVTAELN